MWTTKIIAKTDQGIRLQIIQTNQTLSFQQVFDYWKNNKAFRDFYIQLLADSRFTAFYWEHPGLRTNLLDRPYEFVLLNSHSLDKRTLNETAFAKFFQKDKLVVDFDNLGKNARLVVPTPQADKNIYKHFASFIRGASATQSHTFFQKIGQLVLTNIHLEKTVWLNTAGNGVIWLHVRLDSRPKYYKTRAYKNPDFL